MRIDAVWVKGHTGIPGNVHADALADLEGVVLSHAHSSQSFSQSLSVIITAILSHSHNRSQPFSQSLSVILTVTLILHTATPPLDITVHHCRYFGFKHCIDHWEWAVNNMDKIDECVPSPV